MKKNWLALSFYNPRWWLLLPVNLAVLIVMAPLMLVIRCSIVIADVFIGWLESLELKLNRSFGLHEKLTQWMFNR